MILAKIIKKIISKIFWESKPTGKNCIVQRTVVHCTTFYCIVLYYKELSFRQHEMLLLSPWMCLTSKSLRHVCQASQSANAVQECMRSSRCSIEFAANDTQALVPLFSCSICSNSKSLVRSSSQTSKLVHCVGIRAAVALRTYHPSITINHP